MYDELIGKRINLGEEEVVIHQNGDRYQGYHYTFAVGTQLHYTIIPEDSPEGLKIKRAINKKLKKDRKEQERLENEKKERLKKGEITFAEALKVAQGYYAKKGQEVLCIYETDEKWIVFGGENGEISTNRPAITINKADERMGSFALPLKERNEILKNATLHNISFT